jgi:hypothetical protein
LSTSQATEQEVRHGGIQPGFGGLDPAFIMLAQTPEVVDPTKEALDDPALGLRHELAPGCVVLCDTTPA